MALLPSLPPSLLPSSFSALPGSATLVKVRTPPRCLSATTKTQTAAQLFSSRHSIPDEEKRQKQESKNALWISQSRLLSIVYITQKGMDPQQIRLGLTVFPIPAADWTCVFEIWMTRLVLLMKSISDICKMIMILITTTMWALLALKIRLYIQRTLLWLKSVK